MKKKVFICNTGGTLGMRPTENGYAPSTGFLKEQLDAIPELSRIEIPEFVLEEFNPLLDSANMRPANWLSIARSITDRYDEFDGFVVIHGTDTMAHTASALSFLLQDLSKPVVLTGSQIPLCEARTDARENLITSLMVAGLHHVPEVLICFGGYLLRGNRAKKITANGFDAFQSPNHPPIGSIGTSISIDEKLVRYPEKNAACRIGIDEDCSPQVAAFRLFPGIDHAIMQNLFQPPLKGVVIEAFGIGNAPSNDPKFLDVIRSATKRGVIVVVCTQCTQGRVNLESYAAGRALKDVGAISAVDMTVEAALAKLYYLLNLGLSREEVQTMVGKSLAGELTS